MKEAKGEEGEVGEGFRNIPTSLAIFFIFGNNLVDIPSK